MKVGLLMVPLKLVIILLPALGIMCCKKLSKKIPELTFMDACLGTLGELSAFIIWGKLGWDRSRWVNFWFTLYFGFLYGSYCTWTVFNPPHPDADLYAIFFLCCGWVAFPLFLSQIFAGISDDDLEEQQEKKEILNISLI